MSRAVLLTIALLACSSKKTDEQPPSPAARDAGSDAIGDAAAPWPELAAYTRADAVRTIAIPLAEPDHPRFDVGGPVIAGELAIVATSQSGFVAVDYRRGTVAWTKPAGLHVAPPLVHGPAPTIVLVGDCKHAPQIPDGEALLGCLRVVTTTGSDQAYLAIRGAPRQVAAFRAEKGPQVLWDAGEHAVRWRRGGQAVVIDLLTGVARPAEADDPPLTVTYKGKRWEVRHVDGRVVATGSQGARSWESEDAYTRIAGVVWLEGSPLLRVLDAGSFAGKPEIQLIDMDATGSLHRTIAAPTPGISVQAVGMSRYGDAAIAVRVDRSMERDVIAAYAANALLMYVHALPVRRRVDPIGVAVADDAVVVFHDGDTLTVLPELSAPPTAPGATRGVSQNPTP